MLIAIGIICFLAGGYITVAGIFHPNEFLKRIPLMQVRVPHWLYLSSVGLILLITGILLLYFGVKLSL